LQGRLQRPTNIGNDAWIGTRVVICQGVTIGTGAIVAASCRDQGRAAVRGVGGVPAKLIPHGYAQPDALSRFIIIEILGEAKRFPKGEGSTAPLGSYSICKRAFDASKNLFRLQFLTGAEVFDGELTRGALAFQFRA
jgi:hypothetical protein